MDGTGIQMEGQGESFEVFGASEVGKLSSADSEVSFPLVNATIIVVGIHDRSKTQGSERIQPRPTLKLTPTQTLAIHNGDSNLQLIACAGSGKTAVIARRSRTSSATDSATMS